MQPLPAVVQHSLQIGLIITINLALIIAITPRDACSRKKLVGIFSGAMTFALLFAWWQHGRTFEAPVVWYWITTVAHYVWITIKALLGGFLIWALWFTLTNIRGDKTMGELHSLVSCMMITAFLGYCIICLLLPIYQLLMTVFVGG